MRYEAWKIDLNIKKLRLSKNLTAADLSELLEVSTSHLNQMEQGRRRMSIDLMYKLMDILQVDANTLLMIDKKENMNFSIDSELNNLTKKDKRYLTNIFKEMIQSFPK